MLASWLPRLSPTARALLAAERSRSEDEELKMRALERAEAALAGERESGVLRRHMLEGSVTHLKTRWLRGAVLVAAALAFAGFATAGLRLVIDSSAEDKSVRPAAVVAAKGALHLDPQLPEPPVEASATTAPAPAPNASGSVPRARPASAKQYAIELGLLEPARSGIARGDYRGALGAISKHQHDYPAGLLAEEREALRVRALWGLGQKPAAEAAASSFRKRYPRSGLLAWMKERPAP